SDAIRNAITSNETLLMSGGWIGVPHGHAVYYELIPGVQGKSTLRLYNLGRGIEPYAERGVDTKWKANPVVEWKGVPNENLTNALFPAILHELEHQLVVDTYYNTDYGGQDIYASLKEVLKPESEVLIFEPLTVQRGGFCSWKSLLAYLRTKMDEKSY